ncbi:hypothetical protein GLAREA_01219 [Glarea lozoyensis ATCC 20868]|uniref:Heterokaryon incompatibility domain-containing protein n=1 Tax=Glarea lozoyensis (strain ATCC 20868 / MF5171) TaxID=1116229 RepID=S3CFQ4_GLAL2|nr:uncharacterized protein GLAREA_01219 [Glarea lozoyensis ATCC 20868]EPE25307.1 hypothetical protein GLAREA_01219 [Glarea lozoyensis ATCC 20868]
MLNAWREERLTKFARLYEPLRRDQVRKEERSRDERCENDASINGSEIVWVDSICVQSGNNAERRKAVILMSRVYRNAMRILPRISSGIEHGSRKIKLSRRTKKAIAFEFACLFAALLMQRPPEMIWEETSGTGLPPEVITVSPSGPSRWLAAKEELSLRFGDHKILQNILKELASLVAHIHISTCLSRPHPLLILFTNVAFAFPITYLRYTNRADRHQDDIIMGGMVLAVVLASMTQDIWETTIKILPASIIFGLVLSSLIHRVFGLRSRSCESNVEKI